MTDKAHGIDQLLSVVDAVADIASAADNILADGKVSLWEILSQTGLLVETVVKLAKLNVSELAAELADLDDAEREELADSLAQHLDLRNDTIEHVIEQGFPIVLGVVAHAGELVEALKNFRKPA